MSDATKAVFLSYARDDAAAARRVAEALRSSGLEVWFDENELRGGDAWDQKIRRQINDCTLFVALISQHTMEAGRHRPAERGEGTAPPRTPAGRSRWVWAPLKGDPRFEAIKNDPPNTTPLD